MSYKQYFFLAIFAYITCFIYYIDFSDEFHVLQDHGTFFFEYFGFEGEEHFCVSEDGFQSKIHRVGHGGVGKKVLLIVPGIHCTSEVFFALGPDHDIAYSFNRSGIDVWIPNVRGSIHTKPVADRNFTDDELTNFSFHEQGYYDLSAAIDYVRAVTGSEKISILASSMGASTALVLFATRPEYNDKIDRIILLGPTGPFSVTTTYIQQAVFKIMMFNKPMSDYLATSFKYRSKLCHIICTHPMSFFSCWKALHYYLGYYSEGLTDNDASVALKVMFTGPYYGIYQHFFQTMDAKNYVMRDFGKERNIQKYGTENAPFYNMSNIKVPIIIFNAEEDFFLTPEAIGVMETIVPNIKKIVKVKPPFKHGNFVSNGVFAQEFVEDSIRAIKENIE